MRKKKQFIDLENERYGLFMSEQSIDLDIMYGRNFLKSDNIQIVLVYKLNIIETKTHSLYNQSKTSDKKFFAPVRINAVVKVEEGKQIYQGENPNGITRDDTGNIIINVYLKELEEKNFDFERGDIICYNMSGEKNRYYETESANNITDSTNRTIGGFKPIWKQIVGIPVKSDVIPLLNGETKGDFI